METELWPNTLRALRRGVPVMIANGRISDRSYRRYRLVRRFLASVSPTCACSRCSRTRMPGASSRSRPSERVVVTGNMKADAAVADPAGAVDLWRRLLALSPDQRVWIAGSTHAGEEELVLEAHRAALADSPELVLVIAPRHPERTGEVLALLAARAGSIRRSELPVAVRAPRWRGTARDRARHGGELATLYAIADVVFVGGASFPVGGHNLLEAAHRRKPVLVGPHVANFRESTSLLESVGAAVVVRDAVEFSRELGDCWPIRIFGRSWATRIRGHRVPPGAVRETLELVDRISARRGARMKSRERFIRAGRKASARDRPACSPSPAAATADCSEPANGSTDAGS